MPILDHFHRPLDRRLPWETLHSSWLAELAGRLNDRLPKNYVALETVRFGPRLEIDVGTYREEDSGLHDSPNGPTGGIAVAVERWAPPVAAATIPAVFPDVLEIRVYDTTNDGMTLVGAIEMVSPGNKDRDEARRAFAAKVATYLQSGVSVVLADVVTALRANLHNDLIDVMSAPAAVELPAETELYSVAYRPVLRGDRPEIDLWFATFAVGDPLPTMPLRLTGDLFVPVEFELTYTEACRRRRLI